MTIFASGGSGSLQMVSELVTGQCASLLAVPRREIDTRRCVSKGMLDPTGSGFGGGPTSIG